MHPESRLHPFHVVIAGGGFAALEAALAIRAMAGERVRLTCLSPKGSLCYRPAATNEAFETGPSRMYELEAIAEQLRVDYVPAALESVSPQLQTVRLSTGGRLDYDALILAVGARSVRGVSGARMFRDQRDLPWSRTLVADIEEGRLSRLVFAVPAGSAWPLPLYELALLASRQAVAAGVDLDVSIATPEHQPLEMFGSGAARAVRTLLDEDGVRFLGSSPPLAVRRDGALELQSGGGIPADMVITIPQLAGHRISGIPARWWGFVPTDQDGRVEGLENVYAAGDVTTFPVKQGGLAAQQADRVAQAIARDLGVAVKESDTRHVLQARLVGGSYSLFLRTELDWRGHPTAAALERPEPDGPEGAHDGVKVYGRYLTPYLEQLDALAV